MSYFKRGHIYIIVALTIILFSILPQTRAQRAVSGVVVDSLTRMPLPGVNAVLFNTDSSFIKGVATDTAGIFKLGIQTRMQYILRLSMIGYKSHYVNIAKNRQGKMLLDTIFLTYNESALKDVVVKGTRPDMVTKEDTTSFNAAEYNVPEGESLEELVKLLPGVEIDGTNITYNGKPISEFKINGKDFFKGNRRIALKNLPVELIKQVKTYEKKSDYAEQTGIDDGNEQTVMDIELKKELNETWTTSYDAGVGSYGRYIQKIFANRITDRSRLTLTGNMNDDDARSNNKSFGADFSTNNGKMKKENGRFELGGHIGGHNDHSHSQTWRNAENYKGTGQTSQFSNSNSYNKNKSAGLSGNLRMEWHPDTLTIVTASTNLSFSKTRTFSRSRSVNFNNDPYNITDNDPLDNVFSDDFSEETMPELYKATINRKASSSKGNGDSYSFALTGMLVHRFNSRGRNASFDFNMASSDAQNKTFRISDIYYYKKAQDKRHTFQDQYVFSPTHNWNYNARISYSEPIVKRLHLQTSYSFERSRSRSDRLLYELDSLDGWRNGEHELGELPQGVDSMQAALSIQNSHYSTYDNFNHSWSANLTYNSKKINAFVATKMNYSTTNLYYQRSTVDTALTRQILRFSPSAKFRYRVSKNERVELGYSGWNNEPSMTNRIPVTDNSDPLNIRLPGGNLKPAWNNRIKFGYNKFITKRQQNWDVNAQFEQSSNNISTAVLYDETTGGRTTQPKNINGNWSARTDFTFTTGFGKNKAFRLNSSITTNYDNSVGYISTGSKASSEKNTTRTTSIFPRVNLRYHNDILEAKIGASLRYRHTDNKLRPQSNMDTYNYSYQASARVRLPWKMTVESSWKMNSRRGYSNKSMNTDELVWNATASQNFFKGSPLIVRLQLYDILHNRSNISRTISAQSRVDSENDSSYSYFMLHLILRLNIFNGKVSSGFGHSKGKKKNNKL